MATQHPQQPRLPRGPTPVRLACGQAQCLQSYYAGSILIWLSDLPAARRASTESRNAVKLFELSSPEERSHSDEALAPLGRIYLATARLQLGELDGAVQAYRRVLSLPPERQTSSIVRRMDRLRQILASTR